MKLPEKIKSKECLSDCFEKARSESSEGSLYVVFFDGNSIKRVNDKHGHLMGDLVIYEIAKTISDSMRDTDYVIRFGGDEFVAILPNFKGDIKDFVSRIQSNVKYNTTVSSKVGSVSVSAGVVLHSEKLYKNVEEVIGAADRLMYAAKSSPPHYLKLSYDNIEFLAKFDNRKSDVYSSRKRALFNWVVDQVKNEYPNFVIDDIVQSAREIWKVNGGRVLHAASFNELIFLVRNNMKTTVFPQPLEISPKTKLKLITLSSDSKKV